MGVGTKDPVSVKSLVNITQQALDERDSILQLCDVVAEDPNVRAEPTGPRERQGRSELASSMAMAQKMTRNAEKLSRLQQGLMAAINRLSLGVCILDQACNVIDMNQEFERQVHDYDVFRLCRDGRLDFASTAGRNHLSDLMTDGDKPRLHKEVMPVAHSSLARALCIDIEVLHSSDENAEDRLDGMIIYSLDTSLMSEIDVGPLAQTYELTPTEAKLTEMVCEGMTNAQIAKTRGRAVDTINAQVKSVLAKTSCVNRTQLVRLMTSFGTDFLAR